MRRFSTLAAITAAGATIALGGCGGAGTTKTYPASVRANVISGCEGSGGGASVCSCALKYIESKVSLNTFVMAEKRIAAGGAYPNWLYQAVARCARK